MSRRTRLARRVVGLVASVWVVFTVTFVYFELTPYTESETTDQPTAGGHDAPAEVPVSPTDPLAERYVDWLAWVLTAPEAVVDPVVEAAGFTAAYLVPAMGVAILAGTLVRVYTVATTRRLLDGGVDAVALVGLSVPAFVVAFLFREFLLLDYLSLLGRTGMYNSSASPFSTHNLTAAVWPGTAMAVYLLAVQLHHAGEQLRAYAGEPFVKTARAKGLSDWRVGRHLLRNTVVTLVFVQLTDLYGMVLVGVFTVEYVAGTPGLGDLTARAVLETDLPLVLGVSLLFVLIGVVATFLQDLAYDVADPRVEFEN